MFVLDLICIFVQVKRSIQCHVQQKKKASNARRASGFYAIATLGMDMTAMQTWELYGLRDEQEKYFQQVKSQLGFDRQRNWSEEGKTGRLLILFVGLILSSYVRHIWKSTDLHKSFLSTLEVFDEMRSIRYMEHTGKTKHITPFVGAQIDIANAFGFKIPEGCAPKYTSRKKDAPPEDARLNRKPQNWSINCTKGIKTYVEVVGLHRH